MNVYLLYGQHRFRIQDQLDALVSHFDKHVVVYPDTPEEALALVQEPPGFMAPDPTILVVRSWNAKVPIAPMLENIPDHLVVVFWLDSLDRRAKWSAALVEKIPPRQVKEIDLPPPHKQAEDAADFVRQEFRRHDLGISHDLALALVGRVGSDFGVLRFEIQKVRWYLPPDTRDVSPQVLREVTNRFASSSAFDLLDAIVQDSPASVMRVFDRMDPGSLMGTTAGLTTVLLQYVSVLDGVSKGLSAEAIATRSHINPWVLRNQIHPKAQALGMKTVIGLVSDMAETQEKKVTGARDAWRFFQARILARRYQAA